MISANVVVGILIIVINLIPMILRKWKYLQFTIALSLLVSLILIYVGG